MKLSAMMQVIKFKRFHLWSQMKRYLFESDAGLDKN